MGFGAIESGVCGSEEVDGESSYDWGRCCLMISLD